VALSPSGIFSLDPASYQPHVLHSGQRDWPESNCYIDVYIEVLHALGLDVFACLAFTLASDFEDDQWTFFKPPLSELKDLFGVDVQELTLWRPLLEHVVEHVRAGRLVTPEVDAYYLPDVVATDYRTAHVKTTITINRIDPEQRTLWYFHNAGFHKLEGEDFAGVFRLGVPEQADYLPPYCELMRLGRVVQRPSAELRELAITQARDYLRSLPARNPMHAYGERLQRDLQWLVTQELPTYHAYVFATLRQCGANFELAGAFLRWLERQGGSGLGDSAEKLANVSRTAKMMVMKLARVAKTRKVADLSGHVSQMASDWEDAMGALTEHFQP